MKSYILFITLSFLIFLAFVVIIGGILYQTISNSARQKTSHVVNLSMLEVTSIDTMKYSRDPSREKLYDPSFDKVIDSQMRDIAKTNATYVAIATPYDPEFLPVLKRWVKAARKYKMHVWFRGNFSGWEGWFNYPKIDKETHIQYMHQFIINNPDLFENGDIFAACPECENGGPGDPRQTGDIEGFRGFLITEYKKSTEDFAKIHKKVRSNFVSMNYDVATLIMNPVTTKAMGSIVVVDHYVASPDQLVKDLDKLSQKSGGKVVLGEFGAPIPDIHGNMTPDQQAKWIKEVLSKISTDKNIIGVNYWVNVGGSTQLWRPDGVAYPAVSIISSIYKYYKR